MIDLEAIRERWRQASPGRWRTGRHVFRTLYVHANGDEEGKLIGLLDRAQDATFATAAHADVPALCDEVERLEKENEDLRGSIAIGPDVAKLEAVLLEESEAKVAKLKALLGRVNEYGTFSNWSPEGPAARREFEAEVAEALKE